tara:strand:- start:291 stop:1295 length:1005 start_codon:yes stop_codon:yes gene_type:complete
MINLKKKDHPKTLYGKTGILIINLGTPESYSWLSIRKYLKEFLKDRRVIEVNRILWFFVLNFIILTFRPHKTARNYKKIWFEKDNISPLKYYTKLQKVKLEKKIIKKNVIVDYAMRYGSPDIKGKINLLHKKGCENLIVLPLYPQYASPTTASVCDEVFKTLITMRWQPSVQIIPHYESNPLYIKALVNSLKEKLKDIPKPDLIIASYHGLPQKYFLKGDPYYCYCQKTTRLVKEKINVDIPFMTTFQSRFGPDNWLQPYTDKSLESLPGKGIKRVLVFCPGFSSDCIETLEEIEIQAKQSFFDKGGEIFEYLPCLNDRNDHVVLLENLVSKYL